MAIENNAASIGGGSPYTNNMGCTKARAIALGASLYSPSSGYSDNQLVRYDDLYYNSPSSTQVTITCNYTNLQLSNSPSKRMFGTPHYYLPGESSPSPLLTPSDWPPDKAGTSNNFMITMPPGYGTTQSYTIPTSAWPDLNYSGSWITLNGFSTMPQYIYFYSSISGYISYSNRGGYYAFNTATAFGIKYGMTVTVTFSY